MNVNGWSQLTAGQRLETLQKTLAIVAEVFGRDNERWSRLPKTEREQQIEEALNSRLVTPAKEQRG